VRDSPILMASDDGPEDIKRKYENAKKEFDRLKKENDSLKRENKELENENKELERKIKNLKDELAALVMDQQLRVPSPWFKPNVTGLRRKVGAPMGHKGYSRKIPTPEQITHIEEFSTDHCPHCNTPVQPSELFEERYIWDIPPPVPIIKKLKIYRSWCPICKKMVRPRLDNVFPHKKFGLTLIVFVVFLRMIGLTREKIEAVLKEFYGLAVTTGTLKSLEEFAASKLRYKYDEVKEEIRKAKTVNLDETGWRVDGVSHWLWTFCDKFRSLFVVDRSRGKSVPETVLDEDFDGVIVNDGWTAYNSLDLQKQQCLYHVNRQLQRIETIYRIETRGFMEEKEPIFRRAGRPRAEFLEFAKELRQLMSEAVKFVESKPSMRSRANASPTFRKNERAYL